MCKNWRFHILEVFLRDTLTLHPFNIESVIVNLNTSNQPGSHGYATIETRPICFDSYGQITPVEIQRYLKMGSEFDSGRIKLKHTTLEVDTIAIQYTIYIAQNYFRLPRHTIRENSNIIIPFPQDMKNLVHIHADHCTSDISFLEFKQFCHRVDREKHKFITVDLTSTPMDGK